MANELNLFSRKSYQYDFKSLVHFDYPLSNNVDNEYQDEINNGIIWNSEFDNDDYIENLLIKEKYKSYIPFSKIDIIDELPKFGYKCPIFRKGSYITGNTNEIQNNTFEFNSNKRNEIEFFIKPFNKIHDSLLDINMFNDALIFNGHTFKLFLEELSWNEANEKCKKLNGHLVTITSNSKQKFINSFIKIYSNNNEIFWLNGKFENSWKWDNDEFLIYKNWSDDYNSNNNSNEFNIALINNKWDIFESSENHYYICEWDYNIFNKLTNIENLETPYNYHIYNNHTFKLFNINVNWEDANEICKNLGGNLTYIQNEDKQNFIKSILEFPNSYWIGANNYNGNWLWQNNSEKIKYFNWYENQPDSGENSCIRIMSEYDGKWVDDHSNDINCYFICEWNNNKLFETKITIDQNESVNLTDNKNYFFKNKRYQYFSEYLTWNDTVNKCKKLGGNLLTITSQEESNFITSMIQDLDEDSDIWLGAYSDDNKKWNWITGEKWNYSNWYNTEIDLFNLNQRSVLRMIDGNYWIDEDNFYGNCDQTYKFICEWGTEEIDNINTKLKYNIIEFPGNELSPYNLIFGIDENNHYSIICNNFTYSSTYEPIYNEWQHIFIRININRLTIFLNSKKIILNNTVQEGTNIFKKIKIGNFNGLIDEFVYKYSNNPYPPYTLMRYPKIPKEQYHSTLFAGNINGVNNNVVNDITEINNECSINMSIELASIVDNYILTNNSQYIKNDSFLNNLRQYLKKGDELLFIVSNKKYDNIPNDPNIGKFTFKTIKDVRGQIILLEEDLTSDDIITKNIIHDYNIVIITVPNFNSLIINGTIKPGPYNIIAFKVRNNCIINGNIITNEIINDNNQITVPDKFNNFNENGVIFIGCNGTLTINENAKIASSDTCEMKSNIMIATNRIDINNNFNSIKNNYIYFAYRYKYHINNELINNVINYNIANFTLSSAKYYRYGIWRAENLPEGLYIDEYTGKIYGRCYIPGTYYVTIIHETQSSYNEEIKIITINENDINDKDNIPYITSDDNVSCKINETFTYQITGKNIGEDYCFFDIENYPLEMTVNNKTGLVTWIIPIEQKELNVKFTVIINSNNGIAKKEINLTLTIPNEYKPSFSSFDYEEINGSLVEEFIDDDHNEIINTIIYNIKVPDDIIGGYYFIENAPNGIEIDSKTGQIIWNIYANLVPGKYLITFGKKNDNNEILYVYNKLFIFYLDDLNNLHIVYKDDEDDLYPLEVQIDQNDPWIPYINDITLIPSSDDDLEYEVENFDGYIERRSGKMIEKYVRSSSSSSSSSSYSYSSSSKSYYYTIYNNKPTRRIIYSGYSQYIPFNRNINIHNNCIAHLKFCLKEKFNYDKKCRFYLESRNDSSPYIENKKEIIDITHGSGNIQWHIRELDDNKSQYKTIYCRVTDGNGNIITHKIIFFIKMENKKLIEKKVFLDNTSITLYYRHEMLPYQIKGENTYLYDRVKYYF